MVAKYCQIGLEDVLAGGGSSGGAGGVAVVKKRLALEDFAPLNPIGPSLEARI